eukprot:322237_1
MIFATRMSSKPTTSFGEEETQSFFTKFFNLTLLSCIGAWVYFLSSGWSCTTAANQPSGPYATPAHKPAAALQTYLKGSGTVVSASYDVFTNAVIYICICTILAVRFYLQKNVLDTVTLLMDKTQTELNTEIDQLKKIIEKQERILAAQRKVNKM